MAKLAAALLAALAVAGCSSTGGLFGNGGTEPRSSDAQANGPAAALRSDTLAIYLETLRALVDGDPVAQADAFRAAENAVEAAPTTTNRLNLALALATPGHPSSNPREAQRLLGQLLADGDALLPEERILAQVHLKEVEQRLILDAEAQRLQRAVTQATAARNDQSAQR
ncbi:MAG TPA: hypothetical protein VFO94_13710, partial [Gammaproteobacteria bacterium]|nr:hypothetical protein [Gammaproteobacteria bacterium]